MGNCTSSVVDETAIPLSSVQSVLGNDLLLEKILEYTFCRNPATAFGDELDIDTPPFLQQKTSYSDVSAVLGTSRSWRGTGLKILNRTGTPIFDVVAVRSRDVINSLSLYRSNKLPRIDLHHLRKLKSLDIPPFSLALTEDLFFPKFIPKLDSLFRRDTFWPALVCLYLTTQQLTEQTNLPGNISLYNLPCLRRLELNLQQDSVNYQFRDVIQQIMDGALALDQIMILCDPKNENSIETHFIQWYLPLTVTSFEGWYLNDTNLRNLFLHENSSGLRLKKIYLYNDTTMANTIHNILCLFCETLEEAVLSNQSVIKYPTRFPEMKKLTKLNVCNINSTQEPLADIERYAGLGKNMRSLRVVKLDIAENFLFSWLIRSRTTEHQIFEKVVHLDLELDDSLKNSLFKQASAFALESELLSPLWKIQAIHAAFSNVRRLDLNLLGTSNQKDQIRFIFSNFRQLAVLSLNWRCEQTTVHAAQNDIDGLLIGCPALFLHQRRKMSCAEYLPLPKVDDAGKRIPSICLLKNLTAFQMRVKYRKMEVIPSDFSFQFAFFRMKKLVALRFGSYKCPSRKPSSWTLRRWEWERRTPVIYEDKFEDTWAA